MVLLFQSADSAEAVRKLIALSAERREAAALTNLHQQLSTTSAVPAQTTQYAAEDSGWRRCLRKCPVRVGVELSSTRIGGINRGDVFEVLEMAWTQVSQPHHYSYCFYCATVPLRELAAMLRRGYRRRMASGECDATKAGLAAVPGKASSSSIGIPLPPCSKYNETYFANTGKAPSCLRFYQRVSVHHIEQERHQGALRIGLHLPIRNALHLDDGSISRAGILWILL